MRVETSTATADDRAFAAGLAQSAQSLLPRDDTGMLRHDIQGMLEDVQASRRSTVESHLERVDLLVAAIGLDDGKGGGAEPERLGETLPAARGG